MTPNVGNAELFFSRLFASLAHSAVLKIKNPVAFFRLGERQQYQIWTHL